MWSRIRRTWRMLLNRPLKASFDRQADTDRIGLYEWSWSYLPLVTQACEVPSKVLWLPTDTPRVLYRESDGKVTLERVFQSYEVPAQPRGLITAVQGVELDYLMYPGVFTDRAESPEDAQDDIE